MLYRTLNIFNIISKEKNILIKFKPITETPPQDIEIIKNLSTEYWCAKIYVKKENDKHIYPISSWFSIKKSYIDMISSGKFSSGAFMIDSKKLTNKEKQKFLDITTPIFTISDSFSKKI